MKKIYIVFLLITILLHGCSLTTNDSLRHEKLSENNILTFVLDPWGTHTILLSSFDGIYSSDDGSHTWRYLSQQPNKYNPMETLYPHPYKKDTWFGYNHKNVFISHDGGNSWKLYQTGLYSKDDSFFQPLKTIFYSFFPRFQPKNIALLDISVPKTGSRDFFCSTSDGLYHIDSSQQWRLLPQTLEYGEITHILDIPESDLLLCVTKQKQLFGVMYDDFRILFFKTFPYGDVKDIYYSPQYGILILSNTGIYSGFISDSNPRIMTMNPLYVDANIDILYTSHSNIWMTKDDQLFFSDENPINWKRIEFPISTRILSIQFHQDQSKTFILTNTHGIFYSLDLQNWDTRETPIQECHVTGIKQDAVVPTTLYCSTLNHGVYRSIDHGITWSSMNEGIEYQSVGCLLSVQQPFHALYAGTHQDGLYVSYHPDHQWTIQNSFFQDLTITAISPSLKDEQPMLVGLWDPSTEQSLLNYSFNSGLEWYPVIFPSRINSIQGFGFDPFLFWIGTNHGLYVWDAATLSYEPTIFTKSITSIRKSSWSEEHLFIGTLQGLYEKRFQEEIFQEISCNNQYYLGKIDEIFFPLTAHQTIVIISGGRLYRSTNKGEAWLPFSSPKEYFITTIYNDAVEPNIYYAGTRDNGIIYTSDNGKQWKMTENFLNNKSTIYFFVFLYIVSLYFY